MSDTCHRRNWHESERVLDAHRKSCTTCLAAPSASDLCGKGSDLLDAAAVAWILQSPTCAGPLNQCPGYSALAAKGEA